MLKLECETKKVKQCSLYHYGFAKLLSQYFSILILYLVYHYYSIIIEEKATQEWRYGYPTRDVGNPYIVYGTSHNDIRVHTTKSTY